MKGMEKKGNLYSELKKLAEKANKNPLFRDKVASWDRIIQLCITNGDEENWTIEIKDGRMKIIKEQVSNPHITVKTNLEDFKNIIYGSLKPSKAFLTGRLKADGTIPDLLKLNTIFKTLFSANK